MQSNKIIINQFQSIIDEIYLINGIRSDFNAIMG